MKKFISLIFIFSLLFSGAVSAQEKVEIKFFYSAICPHCAKEEVFLDKIEVNPAPFLCFILGFSSRCFDLSPIDQRKGAG